MCGVIGIFGKQSIGQELYFGLIAMQHRGQDACGIMTYKDGRFHLKKGKGSVQSLFN